MAESEPLDLTAEAPMITLAELAAAFFKEIEKKPAPALVFYSPTIYDAGQEAYAREGRPWPEHYRRVEPIPVDTTRIWKRV